MRNPPSSSSTYPMSNAAAAGRIKGTPTPCCSKVGMKRGPWTPEEDELLASYVGREGEGKWRTLPKRAGLLRCGKSCRLRWMNYLRPTVKRGQIAPDEEDLILRLHRLLGNRWSIIAGRIPGRTDNEIKNYWNTHLSKKLISQGLDPRTHRPLNPNHIMPPPHSPHAHGKALASDPNPNYYQQPEYANPSSSSLMISSNIASQVEHGNDNNIENLAFSEEFAAAIDFQNSHGGYYSDSVAGDMDLLCDDQFSAFLNSFLNDDFIQIQGEEQQQQQLQNNSMNKYGKGDDLMALPGPAGDSVQVASFGYEAFWDVSAVTSSTAFAGHDPMHLGEDNRQ